MAAVFFMEDREKLLEQRLEESEQRIATLEQRVEELDRKVSRFGQRPLPPRPVRTPEPHPYWMPQQNTETCPEEPHKPKRRNLEKTAGKLGYGIFASVLISVSLILFAVALLPNLTDGMKVVLMYLVASALVVAGYVESGKKPFYHVVLACGMGGLYVSMFLHSVYFKMLGKVPLLLLLFAWTLGMLYLSKRKKPLFHAVANAGVFVAIAFGTWTSISLPDFSALLLFALPTLAVCGVIQARDGSNLFYRVLYYPSVYVMGLWMYDRPLNLCMWNGASMGTKWILLPQAALVLFGCCHLFLNLPLKREETRYRIQLILDTALIFLLINWIYPSTRLTVFLFVLSALCLLLVDRWKGREGSRMGDFCVSAIVLSSCSAFYIWSDYGLVGWTRTFEILTNNIFLALVVLVLLLLMRNGTGIPRYFAMIAILMSGGSLMIGKWDVMRLLLLAAVGVSLVKNYSRVGKWVWFAEALYLAPVIVADGLHDWMRSLAPLEKSSFPYFTTVFILAGILFLVLSPLVEKTPDGSDKWNRILLKVFHVALFLFGTFCVWDQPKQAGFHTALILTYLALFLWKFREHWGMEDPVYGVYLGLKSTAVLFVILSSYDVGSPMISLALFLASVGCILLGFRIEIRSLRIYGLCLSMFSLIKLLLVDIAVENTFQKAVCYMVSGILCLVISRIYFAVDKRKEVEQ